MGVSATQTLFDAGATRERVNAAQAATDEAAARYRQTVLTAFQDVEDQLSATRVLLQQEALRRQAATAADQVQAQIQNRYQAGQVSYTDVVTAQVTALRCTARAGAAAGRPPDHGRGADPVAGRRLAGDRLARGHRAGGFALIPRAALRTLRAPHRARSGPAAWWKIPGWETPGNLFCVAAPSGTGKSSLVKALLELDSRLAVSISHTTRAPRGQEVQDREYHFVSPAEFRQMVAHGDFFEHAEVHGNLYGTSRKAIEERLNHGDDVVLEIDWQGALQIKQHVPARGADLRPAAELERTGAAAGTGAAKTPPR